tara:strand:- start:2957 stop:3733 length:777 start_codon:yes stop_codon:yes gene_type:complete
MINIHEYVEQLNVENGETKRLNCPLCFSYKTFSVTNNMGSLLWNCYKVSCNIKGNARVHLSVEEIRAIQKKNVNKSITKFVLPEYVVPHAGREDVKKWCERWGIDANELDLYYDVKDNRVVFPVKSDGKIVDATGRAIFKKLPKWKRYGNSDLPYSFGCGSIAVVVEDCVSAVIVGSGVYVGVAVLGTSLSNSHKRFLSQFSTAIIALDPDALPKTLSFAKELRTYVKDVKILKLKDDIKYRLEEDRIKLTQITPKEI